MSLTASLLCRPKAKRAKKKACARGDDDSGALAEAELTALEADIAQLQVGDSASPFMHADVRSCFQSKLLSSPGIVFARAASHCS